MHRLCLRLGGPQRQALRLDCLGDEGEGRGGVPALSVYLSDFFLLGNDAPRVQTTLRQLDFAGCTQLNTHMLVLPHVTT